MLQNIMFYSSIIIIFIYALILFCIYLIMSINVYRNHKDLTNDSKEITKNPSIAILVPAYNEEITIVDSVNSILNQDYKNIEIIIINDGSNDNTQNNVIASFNLKQIPNNLLLKKKDILLKHPNISSGNIQSIFTNKNITLVNKDNGGKASALNTGALLNDCEYIISVDADTFLIKSAISTVLKNKHSDSDAVSCMVGVLNGNKITNGNIENFEVPKKLLPRMQWLEYVRSFVLWNISYEKSGVMLVISGAFAMMKKDIFIKVNGYETDHLTEDMDITMKIVKHKGKIQYISKFLAWTEVPENIKSLEKQRLRWYQGGLRCIIDNKHLLLNKNYPSQLSYKMMPIIWMSEVLGPWVELFSFFQIILAIFFKSKINLTLILSIWGIVFILHCIYMAYILLFIKNKVIIQEKSKKLYRAIPLIVFEMFTYHFINLRWLIIAHTRKYLNKNKGWNKFERKGFSAI